MKGTYISLASALVAVCASCTSTQVPPIAANYPTPVANTYRTAPSITKLEAQLSDAEMLSIRGAPTPLLQKYFNNEPLTDNEKELIREMITALHTRSKRGSLYSQEQPAKKQYPLERRVQKR